jgi:hypothetical protein
MCSGRRSTDLPGRHLDPISSAAKHEVGIGEHPIGPARGLHARPTVSCDKLGEVGSVRPHPGRKIRVELCGGRSKRRLTDSLHHCAPSPTVRLRNVSVAALLRAAPGVPARKGIGRGTMLGCELAHQKRRPFGRPRPGSRQPRRAPTLWEAIDRISGQS